MRFTWRRVPGASQTGWPSGSLYGQNRGISCASLGAAVLKVSLIDPLWSSMPPYSTAKSQEEEVAYSTTIISRMVTSERRLQGQAEGYSLKVT